MSRTINSCRLAPYSRAPLVCSASSRLTIIAKARYRNDQEEEGSLGSRFKTAVGVSCLSAALIFVQPSFASIDPPKVDLFEPMRYLGRWYEVASLKQGFAGEGQQDCHCTQGVYVPRTGPNGEIKLEVNTFCFHGGSTGRLSGIRGDVTCANPRDLYLLPEYKTELEQEEMVKEKCVLRFPQIPFIPPETYDVIRTDYENYAIVQGSADKSFVQIYSRTPNPGKAFIEKQKKLLAKFGYPIDKIKDTPQDCNVIPDSTLSEMMGSQMMDTMFTNTAPESEIEAGVRFEGPRNLLQSFKDLINIAK